MRRRRRRRKRERKRGEREIEVKMYRYNDAVNGRKCLYKGVLKKVIL